MTNRGKVIKGLEYHLKELSVGKTCFECPYCGDNPCEIHLIADVLAMLKEQPDVVQCEECKYYSAGFCYNPNTYDDVITCGNTVPNWYCADGKRREVG